MKRYIIGGISFLLVSAAIAPAVKAVPEETAAGPTRPERIVHSLSAVNLVELSYRGEFEDDGISSYAKFISAVNRGDLTAEDLVEAGIANGRLPSNALEDDDFLFSVKRSMRHVADHD